MKKLLLSLITCAILLAFLVPTTAFAKTYRTKTFQFTYPDNWSLSKNGITLYLEPTSGSGPKTGLGDTATFYRIVVAPHYEKALNFSAEQKAALEKGLGSMAAQYMRETVDTFNGIAALYPGTYVILAKAVKNSRLNGSNASRVTVTEKVNGKKIVAETVFVSKDQKSVFALTGLNSNGSVTPRKKTFDKVVKSFKILH